MSTERIQIRITADGAKAARREIEGLGSGADKAAKSFVGMGTAIAAVITGAAVKKVISLADTWTDMGNRLRTVTKTSEQFADAQNELFRIAQRTRVPVDGITEGYSRMRVSMERLGLTQDKSLEIQESLAQAIKIGGGGAQESASAMRQLGQAMGVGALKSDEFNSVMENAPVIMEVIAKGMGKQVGDLKALAGEGKITSKVIVDAFSAARVELKDRFGAAVTTVSAAVSGNLMNSLTKLVGKIDEATGATGGLASGIIGLADDIEKSIPQVVLLTKELTDLTNIKGPGDFIDSLFGANSVSRMEFWSLGFVGIKEGIAALTNVPSKGFAQAFDEAGARFAKFRGELAGAKGIKAGANHGLPFDMQGFHAPGPLRGASPVAGAAAGKAEKGATFASVMADLRQENQFLRLSNSERAIAVDLAAAASQLKGKLHGDMLTEIADQLRLNAALVVANDLSEDLGKSISDRMNAAQEARKAAAQRISIEQGERTGAGMDAAFASGGLRDRGFGATKSLMAQEQLSQMKTFGEEMAAIFGPGGTISQGMQGIVGSMGDIIGHSIAFQRSWSETGKAVENLGRSIVAEVISSLVRIPAQLLINETIASSLRAKATAETVAQGGAITAAMAPAAAATSLATAGTNSAGATAAIIGVAALAAGTLLVAGLGGFAKGGYTGNGGTGDVAGVVHGREFVMNAQATARNRSQLEAMNAGRSTGGGMRVTIINQAGAEFETRQVDEGHIEIIARRVVQQTAADVVAADLRSAQSKTGRAMEQTTTAKRRRA